MQDVKWIINMSWRTQWGKNSWLQGRTLTVALVSVVVPFDPLKWVFLTAKIEKWCACHAPWHVEPGAALAPWWWVMPHCQESADIVLQCSVTSHNRNNTNYVCILKIFIVFIHCPNYHMLPLLPLHSDAFSCYLFLQYAICVFLQILFINALVAHLIIFISVCCNLWILYAITAQILLTYNMTYSTQAM